MPKRLIYILLLSLLFADLGYSFLQYLNQPLDGDMAWNLVPAEEVKPILESPFGLKAILGNQTYANPNRFFCHWIYKSYLTAVPLKLQQFLEPIDSVYLACAIAKIIVQMLLLLLLAMVIAGSTNLLTVDFLLACVLVTPLFQANGYRSYMGIIDSSTTYTFFYALPCAFVLLYFLSFIFEFYHKKKPRESFLRNVFFLLLAPVVCLSGPLNPGVVLVASLLLGGAHFMNTIRNSKQAGIAGIIRNAILALPGNYWFFLLPAGLFSLYSLFLGKYNSITIATQIPLIEMYSRLPEGLFYQFFQKLGFPLLFLILTVNAVLIRKEYATPEGKKILNIFKWAGAFSFCYMLLLPLGGFREYRPFILRYDTIMPVTLALILLFGISSLFLIKNMSKKQKSWYLPLLTGVLLIYTIADEPEFENNRCEKSALKEIAASNKEVVALSHDCSVLEWTKIDNAARSELNAQLLVIWKITDKKRHYYNK